MNLWSQKKKMAPPILVTPWYTTYKPEHCVMALHGLAWETCYLRDPVSTEMKSGVTTKQNGLRMCFCSEFPMQVPVYKIQSGPMICIIECINHCCLIDLCVQMQQFCCSLCWRQKHDHLLCPLSQWLFWRWLQSRTNFVHSSLSFCRFSYCLEWNPLLDTLSYIDSCPDWNSFSRKL